MYSKVIVERVEFEADYVIQTECTIRELADYVTEQNEDGKGITKTTVHKDLTIKLPEINWNKYLEVRMILDKHKDEAPYRAGKATQQRWQKIKQSS